jgi:copper chaperone CopZ
MAEMRFKVASVYCLDCVIALRKFIEHEKGVESVEMIEDDKVVVKYEPSELDYTEERLKELVCENVDKLGFKIIE